jgi:antitoxin ParD1/3/4
MQTAEKISITVTAEMLSDLRASVESGEFASTSEAMRDAVRIWQRERLERAERLESIRARIRQSIDDPRPSLTTEEVEARISALFQTTLKSHPREIS